MRHTQSKEQKRASEIFDNAMRMGLMHGEEPMRAMAKEIAQLEGYRNVNTKRLQEIHKVRKERDNALELVRLAKELRKADSGMVLVQAEIMKRAAHDDEYDVIMKKIAYSKHWVQTFLDEVERLDNRV